jgi:tetratricopeptide (TPR) repeat protein
MRPASSLLVMLAAAQFTFAQEKSWVGEWVYPTRPAREIKLRITAKGKETSVPFSGTIPIKVQGDLGGSIRIYDSYREGLADKTDFVLGKDAPDYFDRRVKADPKDWYALLMRGYGLLHHRDYDGAIKDFDESIRLSKSNPLSYLCRGNAWAMKKDYDKAIADYNQALKLSPNYAGAYFTRGRAWDEKKDYAKALRDYNEAMRLDPKFVPTLGKAAWLLATCPDAKIRNAKRAVELAKKATDLVKGEADLLDTLAAAHASAGNFTEAIRWVERAIEINDNDAYRGRLELYRKKQPYRQ